MGNFKFGTGSLNQLKTCHPELQLLAHEALKVSSVDFAINEGHRDPEGQRRAYEAGHSTLPPGRSKHNLSPAYAFDFRIYAKHPGKDLRWDDIHCSYLVGIIEATAYFLRKEGKMAHRIRSGANWDGDGVLKYDHTLWDPVHVELVV